MRPNDNSAATPLVSVIVPVYNAEQYVEEAVRSALAQPVPLEVILVEDGSTDGSLEVCRRLAAQDARVRLFQHPGGANRGVSASRNLGILQARGKYIAFLDADDYYLPNRFERDLELLEANPQIDGVYGATKTAFEEGHLPMPGGDRVLTTLSCHVKPDELLGVLLLKTLGGFCTLGITVRKEIFERAGPFDEQLLLAQDSAMWLKMAAVGRLVAGSVEEPVAVQRRHAGNRSRAGHPYYRRAGCEYIWSALKWVRSHCVQPDKELLLRQGLALAIVAPREGMGQYRRALEIAKYTLLYGLAHLPVLVEVGWTFARRLFCPSRVSSVLLGGRT